MDLKFLFNKENRLMSLKTIAYFIVGVMFCVLPSIMLSTFETLVCILLLVYGSIVLCAYCISPVVSQNKKLMISAIVSVIVGIFLLLVRSFFVFTMAIAIMSLVVFKILVLKNTKNSKNINWYLWLALAIFEAAVSIVIIVFFVLNRFLNISMILVGASLILEALITTFMLIRNQIIFNKQFESAEKSE